MALDYRSEYQRYKRYYTSLGTVLESPVFKAYFTVTLSIFTVAIFIAFAIRPTLATIAGLTRQIEDKQGLNSRLDEKINSLSALQNDYQMIEKDLPLIFAAVPLDPSVTKVVMSVEKTATASGVILETISVAKADYTKESVATVSAKMIPITLSYSGGFDNIKNFLKQILNLPRIINPANVAVDLKGSQTTINVYYMP